MSVGAFRGAQSPVWSAFLLLLASECNNRLGTSLDEAELAAFVQEQFPLQSMLKVVGNGHAFGNMTTCVDVSITNRDSYIISLTNLNYMTINPDNTVTFGAGWDLIDLVPTLRAKGLSVINLGTERVQNYIGAFTTGTHGTGQSLGNLATQVVGFRVMDATGNITIVNQTHNSHLLPAFRISLGALGLITEVTIQAEPLNYLKRTTQVFTGSSNLTQMYSDIYGLYQQYDRMMVRGPHMIWDPVASNWTIDSQMSVTYWEPTSVTGVYNCSTNYCANGCGQCLRDYFCYDEASDAVSTPPGGVCNRFFYAEIEHFLPVENFVAAAVDYTNFQLAEAPSMGAYNNMNMIYELRFVKGDDAWMSPVNTYNLGQNLSGIFAVIEIDWYMTYNNFGSTSPSLRSSFLNLLQQSMDPQCQFVNEFLIQHLGITRCQGIFDKSSRAKRAARRTQAATVAAEHGFSLSEKTNMIMITINIILLALLYQRGAFSGFSPSASQNAKSPEKHQSE
ncbi:10114_t:CDS:2 [Paraglomus brasilianum]|uniref:10114_t:CDS:1 n=1 Tax=Paraglomus brasilianum TaxID=144538 RepID=A0A9N9F215_9GLOM|nr:10114_t:CDS:2 [Paraglomus brasilianum]